MGVKEDTTPHVDENPSQINTVLPDQQTASDDALVMEHGALVMDFSAALEPDFKPAEEMDFKPATECESHSISLGGCWLSMQTLTDF